MTPDQYRREGAEAMRKAALNIIWLDDESMRISSITRTIRTIDVDEVLAGMPPAPDAVAVPRALLRAGCDLLADEYDNLKASITMPDGSLSANPLDAWAVKNVAAMEDWIASVKATLYHATEANHGD